MITDKNGDDSNMNAISPPNSEFVPEFVGRQKAVNIFHSLRTLREQKNVLYVEADGGLGKTWLLQVYIKHCKRQRRPWHTAPDGVDPFWIDKNSGSLSEEGKPGAFYEYFIKGTEPGKGHGGESTSKSYLESPDL